MGLTATQAGVDFGVAAAADTPEERDSALSDAKLGLLFVGINGGLAARFSGLAAKSSLPAAKSADQAFLTTSFASLEKQPGSRKLIAALDNESASKGATEAGKDLTGTPSRSLGEDVASPRIDGQTDATESALRSQLFEKGPSAAMLNDYFKNPGELCYDAMVESFTALKNNGEQPKAIGMLMYKNPWDEAPSNHFATLVSKDGATFVVDSTIRQFDSSLPDSATVMPLDRWESFYKNKAGSSDGITILDTFNTALEARIAAGDLHNVAGKYYQTSMVLGGNTNVLKYNSKFENSIVLELQKCEGLLKTAQNNPDIIQNINDDIKSPRMLESTLQPVFSSRSQASGDDPRKTEKPVFERFNR